MAITAQTTARNLKRMTARHAIVIAAGCALIAAAAVAAQQLTTGSDTTSVQPAAAPVAQHLAAPSQPAPTFYIVGSQEQADAVALAENDAAQIRAFYGDDGFMTAHIVVAPDEEAATATVLMVNDLNNVRASYNLPLASLVDLRGR